MELWNELCREASITSEVQVVGSAAEMVDALKNKTADVAVAALSITSEREAVVDFTQPFYESGLRIVVAGVVAALGAHHLHQGAPHKGGAAFDAVGVAVNPGDDRLGELELYALHDDSGVLPQKPSNNFC
jgi:hypothetical protein